MAKKCRDCCSFDSGSHGEGSCRRKLPEPIMADDRVLRGIWPVVDDFDWCGAWEELTPERLCPQCQCDIPFSDRPDKKFCTTACKSAFKRAKDAKSEDEHAFTCPDCGGHWFGSHLVDPDNRTVNCHGGPKLLGCGFIGPYDDLVNNNA